MFWRNTKKRPQRGRKQPAIVEWELFNRPGGRVIASGETEQSLPVEVEEIYNAEGQTYKQWRDDLTRREVEEFWGALSEFTTDGLGFILSGLVSVVVTVVQLPILFFQILGQSGVSSYDRPRPTRAYEPKSKVNVNVEVNVAADVDVNVRINNRRK